MEKFVITGGKPLHGEVTISGAKNAAVGILPATILAADVCVIENLPDISDVSVSLKILSTLGAQVKMLNRNTYEIDTRHLVTTNVPDDLSRQMRASYYFLGALLSRFGKAQVAMPGGCNLGPRPIDQHLKAFSALGANCNIEHGMVDLVADQLVGNQIYLDVVSVGATMNAMLAAVRAKGLTVIENAAKVRKEAGDRAFLRALHFFEENKRVEKQVQALKENRFDEFLSLITESGNSSWKWLQNCYVPGSEEQGITSALALTELFIKEKGCGACRVHGGGFAGVIMAMLPNSVTDEYIAYIEKAMGEGSAYRMSIRPYGAVCVDGYIA